MKGRSVAGRVRREVRTLARPVILAWVWHRRRDLAAFGKLARAAPSRIRHGRAGDLMTETRLRVKLATDERTKGRQNLVGPVVGGAVDIDAHDEAGFAAAEIARRLGGVREVTVRTSPALDDLIDASRAESDELAR